MGEWVRHVRPGRSSLRHTHYLRARLALEAAADAADVVEAATEPDDSCPATSSVLSGASFRFSVGASRDVRQGHMSHTARHAKTLQPHV